MNFAAQQAIYDRDLLAIEPEMPVTFYFNQVAYTGQQTPSADELLGQDAGYLEKFDFELVARVAAFAGKTPPAIKDTIRIGSTNYKVEKITPSQDGVAFTYSMSALN